MIIIFNGKHAHNHRSGGLLLYGAIKKTNTYLFFPRKGD